MDEDFKTMAMAATDPEHVRFESARVAVHERTRTVIQLYFKRRVTRDNRPQFLFDLRQALDRLTDEGAINSTRVDDMDSYLTISYTPLKAATKVYRTMLMLHGSGRYHTLEDEAAR